MLQLETTLVLDDALCRAPNLCDRFSEEDLAAIGDWVWDGYTLDEASRTDWLRRTESAMDLAMQLQKTKSFPWPDCANIAFPLVSIAAMQFHARAYPALINGTKIVKCRVPGPDETGEATSRAIRIGSYMSYQVLEEDESWEEEHDRLLLQLPITGCVFVKTRRVNGKNVSDLVQAKNLCCNYYSKSIEETQRKTQIMSFYRNDVYERVQSSLWRNILDDAWYQTISQPFEVPGTESSNTRIGQHPGTPDEATPLTFLEQHCSIDCDKDGYAEPYIVTIEATSHKVVRIVSRWSSSLDIERNALGRIIRIQAVEEYTKYELIPSPDDSIYGVGFGVLLGSLNESVNDLFNMLMDAGTLAVAAGGFLARGVKIRGGVYTFSPFEWNRVDSSGDDLQKGIVPLPVREPSEVLFKLLTFLVDYTQRLGGATDATQGQNPGQNTPASTQQSMIEQGQKIYSGLYKRVWRCMKREFRKLYVLNAKNLRVTVSFGQGGKIHREDFQGDSSQVCPEADPNVVSEQMRLQQAAAISQRAQAIPGYNREAAERNLLRAMQVDGIEQIYPGPDKVPPLPNPKMQVEQAKAEGKLKLRQLELQQEQMEFVVTLQEQQRLNAAEIIRMMAQAELYAAEAQGVQSGHQIALIEAMIGAAKTQNDHIRGQIANVLKAMELSNEREKIAAESGGAGAGTGTSPVASGPGHQTGAGVGAAGAGVP